MTIRPHLRAAMVPAGILLATTGTVGPVSAALAAWTAPGAGAGAGAATTMPTGGQPTGTATRQSVTLRWPAATMGNGTDVAGYVIARYNAVNGSQATVGPGCSGVVTTTTCTETSVPAGSWTYTDTPVQMSWTGGQSPPSAPISVSPT